LESLDNFKVEFERFAALLRDYTQEISVLQGEFTQLQTDSFSLDKDLLAAKQEVQLKEKDLAEARQKSNDKMIELITLQGQKERLENDSLRLIEAVSQAQISAQAKAEQKEKIQHEIKLTEEQILKDQEELKQLESRKEKEAVVLNEQVQKEHRLLGQINLKEQELKIIRKAQSESQEEIHRLDLDQHELNSQLQQLQNRIWEEYEIDLNSVPELTPEEEEKIPAYQEEIYQLRNRLKSYGAVNLLALEDYQREKERLDFLQKQVQDLVSAKETLQTTINKINDTARTLFLETFQQVKSNFQKVLANLFDGGEADLILEEGADPLEAKIEIMAKPRGKKLVTLAQLSGGEKALVAISLLFSLYLVKPSPFCILDEVDAPLDDSNISRFIKLVRQFTDRTQFIIITHNKLTMEAADSLYGVTMIEPGVSQIVSVRLSKEPVVQ
jgi:chromosome segregation protein